jgi:hypothetical protein
VLTAVFSAMSDTGNQTLTLHNVEATTDFSAWTSIAYVTNWSGLVDEVADRAVLTHFTPIETKEIPIESR